MKKSLLVNNFAEAGINSDIMPWDLPPDSLTDMRNVRIVNTKLTNYAGHVNWSPLPELLDPGFIMNANTTNGQYWIIAGKGLTVDGSFSIVVSGDGINYDDMSLVGEYAAITNVRDWSGCMLSRIPILNNNGTYPQYWAPQDTGTPFAILPWDSGQSWKDAEKQCDIMRSHKQYLIALGIYNSGNYVPDAVRWSAPADIGGLPPTWDELDVTDVAGYTTLGADGGRIIDGLSLRDAFVIYRETAISVMDYVGAPYIWRIRTQSSTFGILNADCLVEVNGLHYFIGRDGIYVNDGNNIQELLHNRLSNRFLTDFKKDFFYNAFAVKYDVADEIWFCIPSYDSESEYASVAYVYNWKDNSWFIIDLPNGVLRSAAYGTYSPSIGDRWDDDVVINWSQKTGPWNKFGTTPIKSTLVGIQAHDENPEYGATSGALVSIDPQTNVTEFPSSVFIERVGFPIVGFTKVGTVSRIYPHMSGDGEVWIYIGAQDYAGSPIRWKDRVKFRPGVDRKVDVKSTGEFHCFKVESVDPTSGTTWFLSGWDIEYIEAGER